MTTIAIIQARTNSKRLPGKVLLPLDDKPMILFELERVKKCQLIDKIVMATSENASDDALSQIVATAGFEVFRGSLDDVLDRYAACAEQNKAETVVRLTGDCPLIDHSLIDEVIDYFHSSDYDYISNTAVFKEMNVPDGMDVEVLSIEALRDAQQQAKRQSEREHVTPWIRSMQSKYKCKHYKHTKSWPYYRLTVDEYNDYNLIYQVVDSLKKRNSGFGIEEITAFLDENPGLAATNQTILHNEGYLNSISKEIDRSKMSTNKNTWSKAKKLIPGGNMLLSKRPEMFLPGQWPGYFSRAKGCKVWDLENICLTDMYLMGVGTNILGYGDEDVDRAVIKTVGQGNMSSLNCPEEVELAETLVDLHPWADMVRFARTGGEANSIAIRIARAATGKDAVAICGYHGWHDWYLATNLESKHGLSEHILPGLNPKGVPTGLQGTIYQFGYNNLEQLEKIIEKKSLAAVKMEVQRSTAPRNSFLQKIRQLCTDNNIILIFDECTSGFRETLGGLHLKYNVSPDIAIFGKALGNGYAITSVIGKCAYMEAAQDTFISSTFWTERIGPTASLATIRKMKEMRSWELISAFGEEIKVRWSQIAEANNIPIKISGLSALPTFSVEEGNPLLYKSLITQEMLKRGYLAGNACYVATVHTKEVRENYYRNLDECFELLSKWRKQGSLEEHLEGEICHAGFKRLN